MANEPISEAAGADAPDAAKEAIQAGSQPLATASEQARLASVPAREDEATPSVRQSFAGFDCLLAMVLLGLVFLLGSFPVTNSDVLMHMATGRKLAQGEYQFRVDPFSFATQATAAQPATPWINHSWLYSLVFYLLFSVVGEAGIVVAHALVGVALALALLLIHDRRSPLLLSVFFVSLTMIAISPRFLVGSASFSMLLFGITLYLVYRAGVFGGIETEHIRPRWLWGVPLLCVLWVNIDNWFILGPLTLGLAWAGAGVNRLLGVENGIPGKDLGMAFGLSLLACLANPHLHEAFVLPPDLAYFLVRIGLPVPEAVAPGGYAMLEFARQEPRNDWLSPFASAYSTNANLGANVAGWSFFVTAALGLFTFVLHGLAGAAQGRITLMGARALPWFVFGILALNSAAMVPWFAIVSAPIAALNLGEWLSARHAGRVQIDPGIGRLGRLFTLLLLLVALGFAWQGWLHTSPGNFAAARRIGWRFALDPAQIAMAERLDELNRAGKVKHVFNFSLATPNFVAWYAPGVHCLADTRVNLFSRHAKTHGDWKKSLFDDAQSFVDSSRESDTSWRDAFRDHGVDHLAIAGPIGRDQRGNALVQKLWLENTRWTLRFGDANALLFAWGGLAGNKPDEDYVEQRTREVFTTAPPQRRPGVLTLPPERDTWDLLVSGTRSRPGASWDVSFHQSRLYAPWTIFKSDSLPPIAEFNGYARTAGRVAGFFLAAPVESATPALALTFALSGPMRDLEQIETFPSGRGFFRPQEYGLPSIPLMMVHDARRVLSEHPNDGRLHVQVAQAYTELEARQEEFWANYHGLYTPDVQNEWLTLLRPAFEKGQPSWRDLGRILKMAAIQFGENRRILENRFNRAQSWREQFGVVTLRRQIRQAQALVHLRLAADLLPDDYFVQRMLGEHYLQHYFLDLALEQFQKALALLAAKAETKGSKEYEELEARAQRLESFVKDRKDDFDRKVLDIMSPVFKGRAEAPKWLQLYDAALNAPFVKLAKGDRREVDPAGRGLAHAALKAFQEYPQKDLAPEELEIFNYLQLDLMLRTGHVGPLLREVEREEFARAKGPLYSRLRALAAGVMGDYAALDRSIKEMESFLPDTGNLRKNVRMACVQTVATQLAALPSSPPALNQTLGYAAIGEHQQRLAAVVFRLIEFRAVRGLAALEAGDGVLARKLFDEAMALNEETGFDHPELRIAAGYLTWLNRYQAR